jgi:hypothetical protein
LPLSVLHQLVADIPGPRGETGAERASRFAAQLAEVLTYNPRNSAEAMIATHCILLRLLAEDAHRDSVRPHRHTAVAGRSAKQFDKLLADLKQTLADFQAQPLQLPDAETFIALGLGHFLIPGPKPEADAEEAFSAIIVPLHPAPKILQ